MIVVDTCIISSLAKVGRLGLLGNLSDPRTSPGVVREISNFGNPVLLKGLTEALAGWLEVGTLGNPEKLAALQEEYPALGHVDCELILLARELGCALLTDDSRLIDVSESDFGIETYDLCDLLVVLRNKGKLGPEELECMIGDLEMKDHYHFSKESLKRLGL